MEEIDLLDTSWIESYEDEEKYYTMFYPESNKSIKTNILYINKGKINFITLNTNVSLSYLE